jgi:hypothetical protein
MTTNTTTPAIYPTDTTTVEFLGEGNWEVTAPNGVWTITADQAMDEATGHCVTTTDLVSFQVEHDTNHHMPVLWADTLYGATQLVAIFGTDGRTNRRSQARQSLTTN